MEGAPLDDSVVDWGDDSIRSTNNGVVSKAEPSKSNSSIPTANKPQQQQPRNKQYRTLHEHLHTELTQLISVKPPLPSSTSGPSSSLDTSDRRKQTSLRPVLLDKYTPSQLVIKSKNEDRRINKVTVVDRFIEVLRFDQTGNFSTATSSVLGALSVEGGGGGSKEEEIVTEVNGPIHGCVSTHWKLLPPIYNKPPPSPSNNLPKVYKPGDGGNQTEERSATINTDATLDESGDNSQDLDQDREVEEKEEEEMLIKGGGIKLPGLDWNKTFRKGYSILVWVRPSLLADSLEQQSQNGSSAIGGESEIGSTTKNKEGRRKPQKQILYRFATSSNDNTSNSVGVCAMLGQWTAVPLSSKEDGESSRRMLTTTVTAYTLPNSNPMSQLYPDDNETSRQQPPSTAEKAAQGTELGLTEETVETKEQQRKERKKNRSSKKDKAPTIGLVTPGNSSRQLDQVSQRASTSTTTPRLVGKLKKSSLRKGGGSPRSRTKSNDAPPFSNQKNNNNNGYISSTLTLPENEWTLLSIQHTHPYLRRPELSIQVNGMTVFKDEIGYPILDAVIFPSNDQDDSDQYGGGLGIHPSWSGDALESPQKKGNRGRTTSDMDENVQLRRRGILADCTLLNGAFDNGVQVLDSSSSRRKKTTTLQSCTTSVHSLAILPGPPLPNAVLAMIAERGPISDVPSCSGLSFVLGPVPTNPQNRDGIVALNAGHGFYGSAPDNSNVGGGTPRSPGRGGIMGGGGYPGSRGGGGGVNDLAPPRSLGIPVSIGITPGVYPAADDLGGSDNSDHASELESSSWIGRQGEEHAAHVCLQGLLGRVAWTFHSADSKTLGGVGPSINSGGEGEEESDYSHRERIVCQPSTGPSRIGGADAVPKVGIVRPTPPNHVLSSNGMEVTGNASLHNVTWNYIQQEMERDSSIQIRPSSSTNSKGGGYNLDDNPPISFSRAMQGANTMNLCTLPFRLALPHAGTEEVNDTQRTIHVESFAHLNDLLCNDGELAASLISLVAECIRCGGSAIRDEALQNGVIHALASLIRKVLIRGSRLGILSSRGNGRPTEKSLLENYDYDKDHDSSCPPIVPSSIADAIVSLVDACCGPSYNRVDESSRIQCNPSRGILRIRRASDLALTAVFGLALDFDLLGNDPMAAAPILKAVASRYCPADTVSPFNGEDYGSLLRKQVNLQYFLDCIRIRFDHSVESSPPSNGGRGIRRPSLVTPHRVSAATNDRLIESVALSLSDILYTMLLSTLTSAAGISVSRGERDVGALVATLTECPLGSLCAHVVTTAIARLLVKCGVMSSLCLGPSSTTSSQSHNRRRSTSTTTLGRIREPEDIALESRLGRNMLLCHYHDIVAPLLLSRSTPRSSPQLQEGNEPEDDEKRSEGQELSSSVDFTNNKGASEVCHPLDWSHHWRLSLLTFTWLSSLAGLDESQNISNSTGNLLLLAGKAGSLDGAVWGYRGDKKSSQDLLAVLSHFLVLSSSRVKESSGATKRAESISRRLQAFMPLLPGIALSLLSPFSVGNDGDKSKMMVTDDTVIAVETLKSLLSMLSLAIQALYGSKKGGLLSSKAGSKSGSQLIKAKKVFVAGAKEYVPTLLQVVSLLDEPVKLSRQLAKKKSKDKKQQDEKMKDSPTSERQSSEASQPTEQQFQPQRKHSDSSDKDWVDVDSPAKDGGDGRLHSDDTLTSSPLIKPDTSAPKTVDVKNGSSSIEQSVHDDLSSIQDMALYSVSRLVAQAMKYGGGEASTAIWRSVIASLSVDTTTSVDSDTHTDKKENGEDTTPSPPKAEKTLSKSTLCHLAALVLSKFARHHDQRLETYRSPWNIETCSAVARLTDLCEEKQLLSQAEIDMATNTNRRGSGFSMSTASDDTRKYGIDQVRLLKALLEVMASGRESGGWAQIKSPSSPVTSQDDDRGEDASKNDTSNGTAKAIPSGTYDLYHQASSEEQQQSKLLLPILQSCVRIVCPATSIIKSEAVVITASSGSSPSTAKLLGLVCTELRLSLLCAIQGLNFPVSRDIFMNAVASLRQSIAHHEIVDDTKAVVMCSSLLMEIVRAMRTRYMKESTRKENASFDAYEEDNEEAASSQDETNKTEGEPSSVPTQNNQQDIHSQVIEKLILGDSLPRNDADFVAEMPNAEDPSKLLLSPMGWSHYKGLGAALHKCYSEQASAVTPQAKAKLVLSILETYIDNWDKIQIQDAAEAELVDLFDINLGSTSKALINDFNSQGQAKAIVSSRRPSSANFPSLSTSDAMARFIEAQSMLRHQHHFLAFDYLVGRRYGRTAFVERLCWKTWMDCVDSRLCNGLWERAVNDGGRDFSSKIVTLPLFPQFPRFIPSYLDHSPTDASMDIKVVSKRLSVKIVDITKKEVSEEMLERLDSLNESATPGLDETMEVFDEEEADMHFARGTSNYSATTDGDADTIDDPMAEVFDEEEADMQFGRVSEDNEEAESETADIADEGTHDEDDVPMNHLAIQQGSFHFAASSFAFPPDSSSLNSLGGGRRLGGGTMEEYYSSCLQVKPDCSLKCTLMLTESHLIVEYEEDTTEDSESPYTKKRDELSPPEVQKRDEEKHMKEALRPKAVRYNISEASHIYLRRYRLRDSALELFFIPSAGSTTGGSAFFAGSRSLFIDFGAGTWGNTRRDDAANAIMKRAPQQTVKQWPDKSGQFLHEELKKLMQAWSHGAISNFDYLLSLNVLAGRSYNDICQYPVFPWVLSDYTSEEVPDLEDRDNYRDMSKPMGALNEERLSELLDRFKTFDDPSIPPFMYGSHYSTSAGVVIHFLLRLHPFASLHRQLQSGHFDVADRLFSSVQQSWSLCTGRSNAEVKELTPEFYSNPAFLRNTNGFKLGTSQEGEVIDDVVLPPWAKGSPERFVEVMRLALESDIASEMLPSWIDLIFGKKQQGKASIEANNVFFYLTYYGSVDVASIEDEGLRKATELQIAHFGQCPMQLFYRKHAKRQPLKENHRRRQTLSDLYDIKAKALSKANGQKRNMPFRNAPLSYWVHLGAPPPGPHAPLVSIRLALADRCLAVDSKGIFHFFRWAWKPDLTEDELSDDSSSTSQENQDALEDNDIFRDKGCFVAQRELFSFRNIPRLPYAPPTSSDGDTGNVVAAISQTLFANRSLLLAVSDGDGKGALAMQLVDPSKGEIKGEVIVPSIHADCITSIDMDPIGTAAGQGGVGGELVICGSADGSASLWRFISSHYWPLRPRLRMMGHGGARVHGVAISSSLGICVSISSKLCCLFDVGNAAMIRNFTPPEVDIGIDSETFVEPERETTFADTPALCLSILGFVITVCSTKLKNGEGEVLKEVLSLELFTVEGNHVSSHILKPHLGMPKKIISTVDGRAVFVCAGGGVSVHLVSSIHPLITIDKWDLDESSTKQAVYDLDFGSTIGRPVVAAAGCSAGTLCLHALRGISKWSHEHQRNTVSGAVGSVLALPAQTVKNALGGVSSFGSSFFGSAKEVAKEAVSVVKEEGGFFRRRKKG